MMLDGGTATTERYVYSVRRGGRGGGGEGEGWRERGREGERERRTERSQSKTLAGHPSYNNCYVLLCKLTCNCFSSTLLSLIIPDGCYLILAQSLKQLAAILKMVDLKWQNSVPIMNIQIIKWRAAMF